MNQDKKIHPILRRGTKHNRIKILVSLVLCIGAAAFYWAVASATDARTVSVQPSSSAAASSGAATQSSSQAVSPSSGSPSSQSASSAVPSSAPAQQAAQTVSLQEADKPLWVKVDIPSQKVIVYDAKDRVVQDFVCSTGKAGDDTPTGTYKTELRGESFFSQQYQEGGYYWTQFQGDFLFHSVPFDKNRKIEEDEAQKLGTKASHGCVRLAIENAKWIYDNIPKGTKVVIA